jgi:hypothetical protein
MISHLMDHAPPMCMVLIAATAVASACRILVLTANTTKRIVLIARWSATIREVPSSNGAGHVFRSWER